MVCVDLNELVPVLTAYITAFMYHRTLNCYTGMPTLYLFNNLI